MTNCLTDEKLERFRRGDVRSAEEFAAIDSHLADCAECRTALNRSLVSSGSRITRQLVPEDGESTCLDEELITAYAEDRLDAVDREVVESHSAGCTRCRADLDAMRAFHQEMRTFDWTSLAAPSFWTRLTDLLAAWRIRTGEASLRERWVCLWNGTSLSARILLALTLGMLTGQVFGRRIDFLEPLSAGILNLLGLVAMPLIFVAVIHVLMRAEIQGRTAHTLTGLLLTNSLVAVGIGCLVIQLWKPGARIAPMTIAVPQAVNLQVPDNILEPLVHNNVLLILLLAVSFGIAMRSVRLEQIRSGQVAYQALEDILETLYRCLLQMLHWVISLMPVVVFVESATLIRAHGLHSFPYLGGFVLSVLLALVLQSCYYLVRLRLGSSIRPFQLFQGVRSALLTAFSTASSAATMPITYDRVKNVLGISEQSTSFGVLVGGSLNRDGTALFEAMGVFFLTQLLGLHLGPVQIAVLVLMTLLASICAPGVPEAGLVTMTLVLRALGIPQAVPFIVLLLPMDWFLDRCRTAINVMGHITVACLLDGKRKTARETGRTEAGEKE